MTARPGLLAIAAAAVLVAGPARAAPLEPYQLIRSLQILQDRIANGDQAALPMQQTMLGIIDKRLRAAGAGELADPRNRHALLIYGASGGNPGTLQRLLAGTDGDGEEARLGRIIVDYANGNMRAALDAMQDFDPMALDSRLAPSAALIAATVLTTEDPARAAVLLDEARLLSPGTLIEEAALRRSIPIAVALKDAGRLMRACEQYARRFLRSPYAGQFAESLVSAVIALHETVDLAMLDAVTAHMSREQARVTYLRLARMSAIEGYERLHDFAAERAIGQGGDNPGGENPGEGGPGGEDPRAVLYANMAAVSSTNVDAVLAALEGIDRRRLSDRDRALLDAAIAIARAVTSPPEEAPPHAPPMRDGTADALSAAGPQADQSDDDYMRAMHDRLKAVDALLAKEVRQ